MPPISGWGMGIDRIIQILTGQNNIKDTVMFPLMRPLVSNETTSIPSKEENKN